MNANHVETRPTTNRLALIGLTALGMAMCTPGVGKVAASGQWLTFQGIAGSLLGAAVLAMVGARLLGRSFFIISSDRAAMAAIIAVAALKYAIALIFVAP